MTRARLPLAGISVSTLWLYPLLNGLTTNAHWLHWRTQDTIETASTWLLLAALVAATLALLEKATSPKVAEAILALWLGAGAILTAGALVKLSLWANWTGHHREAAQWLFLVTGAAYALLTGWLVFGKRWSERRPLLSAAHALSPIALVMLFNLGTAQWQHLTDPQDAQQQVIQQPSHQPTRQQATPLTVVLLFDELSADFLYGSKQIPSSELPALHRFLASATIYSHAYLPGGATELAIPTLFNPSPAPADHRGRTRTFVDDLVMAKRDIRVWGWYLDYCGSLAAAATRCHAVSAYNPRTLDSTLSLLHPLWTTLNLLPSTPPFDVLKARPATEFHRQTLASSLQWLRQQLADPAADVIYVHLNIPHVPYLGSGPELPNGRARFVMTPERYAAAMRLVDDTFGEIMVALQATTPSRPQRVLLLSDHNARVLTTADTHQHVVFAARDSEAATGQVIDAPVHAGELLREHLRLPASTIDYR